MAAHWQATYWYCPCTIGHPPGAPTGDGQTSSISPPGNLIYVLPHNNHAPATCRTPNNRLD